MPDRGSIRLIATSITRIAGSGIAILLHAVWFTAWVVLNQRPFDLPPFDPFPHSLLTMIVSLEAIFLTLFVLISQNRMSREADHRAELDLQVNLLAERESTMTLRILNDIAAHMGLKSAASKDLAALIEETRLSELSHKLEKALPAEK
jgi:uncharacterized membrane protein